MLMDLDLRISNHLVVYVHKFTKGQPLLLAVAAVHIDTSYGRVARREKGPGFWYYAMYE